ncbi:MAG: HNH endonuclease [Candidatus Latescibacterota bacterium]|nr:HNH endonuclease [Candidatus Latescibacterota bacterium]
MIVLDRSVLVLNQNYEPLNVCSVRRALALVFRGKASSVETGPGAVRSVSASYAVPSVVRLERYVRAPRRRVVLSKRNVLRRDNYECQYCGIRDRKMTIDHVIPKTHDGPSSWENLVAACATCNARKGSRQPEQAGLALIRKPRRPNNVTFIRNHVGVSDHLWKPYLFLD